jgi:uncharacterized protein YjbI with pentapeptide repeats
MAKLPNAPYPPDLAEEQPPQVARLGDDLLDVVVMDVNWANGRAHRWEAQRAELRGCRLTGIELAEARVRDVTFEDCRLDLAGVRHARLERVVFRDCRMNECDLYGSALKDVLFERCELREATFSKCTIERVDFRHCDLAGAHGAEALRGTRMLWPDIVENAAFFALALGIEIVSE